MKALILNSGMGTRMGAFTSEHPKCMTEVRTGETILSRQLEMLVQAGIQEAVMTTGPFAGVLANYCRSLGMPIHITYVENPDYRDTNYIYSIYCAREYVEDDILLMHGDLVFDYEAFDKIREYPDSCMAVSTLSDLSEKDFKAVINDGFVQEVGTGCFTDAVAAQPLYKLNRDTWSVWLAEICRFCESGDKVKKQCYAEDALNIVAERCGIHPLDLGSLLCTEVDNQEDLAHVTDILKVNHTADTGRRVGQGICGRRC